MKHNLVAVAASTVGSPGSACVPWESDQNALLDESGGVVKHSGMSNHFVRALFH